MKVSQAIENRHSVRFFKPESIDEERWQEIYDMIDVWDTKVGPLSTAPRLNLCDKGLAGFPFKNELGWIVGSCFVPKDKEQKNLTQVDLGYKMFMLCIDLEKNGYRTCFNSQSLDSEKKLTSAKKLHTMEFNAPVALAFGIENKNAPFYVKWLDKLVFDKYRLPVTSIVEKINTKSSLTQEYEKALEVATKSPSFGNTQTWRIIAEGAQLHFYAVSGLEERFLSIGCLIAAFELVSKEQKINGGWERIQDPPTFDGDYVLTWVPGRKK